jgi:hypothetical protein
MLVAAALSAFVAYNYMNVSFEVPETGVFVGKTINTSELYHTDRFSWYTYDQIDYRSSKSSPYIVRMTTIYDEQAYNGSLCLHKRDIYTSTGIPMNFTRVNDFYFDDSGRWIADQFRSYDNSTLIGNGTFNDYNYTYEKMVFLLPYGFHIAPQGTETITVGNTTYVCDKYYRPSQKANGNETLFHVTYWFNASIPVPVKVQPEQEGIVFELADWG